MLTLRILPILLAILFCTSSFGQQPVSKASSAPAPVVLPAKDSFHIYLLMGQSNMVGRDTKGMGEQVDNPHILMFNEAGRWVVARDPLHHPPGRTPPGVGPGMTFAAEMLKTAPNITIGLVPCAVGGTPLERWVKGGDLYEKAVARAKQAAQSGVISGMLWHQGESDCGQQKNADTYETRLSKMLLDLRMDLGLPNLPIVVGQLGTFLIPEKHPFGDRVRAAIKHIPVDVPNTGYADSEGLEDKGDKLHFNADSQRTFGTRYAAAMEALKQ